MKKPKINTMSELSAAIGVSRPTLSRYFQSPENVRFSTSQKIRQGLDLVEYVPNFFATRMNRKSSGLIGVIIPHLNDLFFTSLLEVIETAAMQAGFTVIIQSSHGDTAIEADAIDKLLSMSADGAIVAPLGSDRNHEAYERMRSNIPLVFMDSHLPETLPGVDYVGTDNFQSIAVIVNYLVRTGDPPVFLGMPRLNTNSRERMAAYVAAMNHLGEEPRVVDDPAREQNWNFEDFAYRLMDDQFSRGNFTDATLLCANDRLAIGVLRAANQHGLFHRGRAADRTLRIAGHDDHPLSRFMSPALTTVAQDVSGIGREAVEILGSRIRSGRSSCEVARCQTFDAVLRVRESA